MFSFKLFRASLIAILASLGIAGSARAAITFDVGGLAGTGVTGQVTFSYTGLSSSSGSLTITIENTTTVGGRISGFAFNVPTIGGATFTNIGGALDGGSVLAIGSPNGSAIPEGSASNESGWYSKWASNAINTNNGAGNFDFGVMNSDNASAFITDGVGSGPRINNLSDSSDSTTFTLSLSGSGLQSLSDADFESLFMSELSSDAGFYSFAVRYQGVGLDGQDSDLAVPTTTTNAVPLPGGVALAALGLGLVGVVNRKRSTNS